MPRGTWETTQFVLNFQYGVITLYDCSFQNILVSKTNLQVDPQPLDLRQDLDCSGFARRYLRNLI